ncbi:MAG: molybdopterin molybdotransferase MoeA [Deltaproteobacteria bacterium]|nr:molybdopterin molybdotransferase MoeA [Deltaproteobacteria bacterium]
MLTYKQALQQVVATIKPLPPVELPLTAANGLVLSAPLAARWDMPRWDNSAMDGFAFAAASAVVAAGLKIVGRSFAGHPFGDRLRSGEAIQITTGAPLPPGADTVVPVEDTIVEGEQLLLQTTIRKGQHVRYRGEEYRAGEELLAQGVRLTAGGVGLLAGAGIEQVRVFPRPRVAIFSTGDELVELGQQPGPGQIVNSNLQYLVARLHECDCIPVPLGIGEDHCDDLDRILDRTGETDLLLTTGGVSVGEKDLVKQTLLRRGFEQKFWKVAIKPGKPVLFGTLDGKPCFGLPGNPAATAATFELFVRPALSLLAGAGDSGSTRRIARLSNAVKIAGSRQLLLWCRCSWTDDGYRVEVPRRQDSGQARSIQGANALLPVPIGSSTLPAGAEVEIILLRLPCAQAAHRP